MMKIERKMKKAILNNRCCLIFLYLILFVLYLFCLQLNKIIFASDKSKFTFYWCLISKFSLNFLIDEKYIYL